MWENRYIKLVATKRRRNYLVSETNYYAAKFFKENLLMIEIKKRIYLGLSKLVLSKILMYEFWYDYVKPKHGEKISCKHKKQMIFIKILQKMLKLDLIHQIMS